MHRFAELSSAESVVYPNRSANFVTTHPASIASAPRVSAFKARWMYEDIRLGHPQVELAVECAVGQHRPHVFTELVAPADDFAGRIVLHWAGSSNKAERRGAAGFAFGIRRAWPIGHARARRHHELTEARALLCQQLRVIAAVVLPKGIGALLGRGIGTQGIKATALLIPETN